MAIYTFKQGEFSKLADRIEEVLKGRIVKWNSFSELFDRLGFYHRDDVAEVYDLFHRRALESSQQKLQSWMPTIHWAFVVTTSDEGVDLILVEDSLPDYLGVLNQLRPLIERRQQLLAEFNRNRMVGDDL